MRSGEIETNNILEVNNIKIETENPETGVQVFKRSEDYIKIEDSEVKVKQENIDYINLTDDQFDIKEEQIGNPNCIKKDILKQSKSDFIGSF